MPIGADIRIQALILFIYQFISRNNTEFIQVTGTKKASTIPTIMVLFWLGDAFLVPVCYGLSSNILSNAGTVS